MIKIIIAIVFLLLSVTCFAQSPTKMLAVDIRGVGCHGGSGLCSVMAENSKVNANNVFITKESLNTFFLNIDASQLSIEEQRIYIGKEYSKVTSSDDLLFTQDADFVLDEQSLIDLDIESKYNTIKKGSYPCEIIKDKIQVKMTLLEH